MKYSQAEADSIVVILTRIYGEIREIEEQFQLLIGEHDFRPRIDYFHDAVRAFTSDKSPERLSVELLTYDLSCLRYIHSMPLSSFKPHGAILSPKSDMVAVNKDGLTVKRSRPDRATREKIVELYQNYAVLFAALLKPFADRDYHERTDNLNQDVQDIHDVIQQLAAMEKGKGSLDKMGAAIQHLEDDELRHALMTFMQEQKHKKKENLKKLMEFLKAHSAKKDKEIAGIDAAHMNYSLSQLAIFEGAKDMLKKMASKGMNLVGKFVENAVAESKNQMGR